MKEKMLGKKAGVFAIGMVLGMIIFMSLTWYSFLTTNKKISVEIAGSTTIANNKNTIDNLVFYIDEAKKLAASQAFYEIAKEWAIDLNVEDSAQECKMYNEYIIWSQNCKPEQEKIEAVFIKKYNESFYNLLNQYLLNRYHKENLNISDLNYFDYVYTLEGEKIISSATIKTLSAIEKANFATYNISYNFDPSTTLDLKKQEISLNEFESIYQETNSVIEECKALENNEENSETEILSCIKSRIKNSLEFKKWIVEVKKEGSFLIFELKTKKYFFFTLDNEGKFSPITLAFAIVF